MAVTGGSGDPSRQAEGRKATLLIADEMALVREGIACLCETKGHYHVVAQCSDGEQAFAIIEKAKPDLALLDYGISRTFVLEVIRKARLCGAPTRIVVMAARADRKTVIDTLRSGAHGFVPKASVARDLLEALDQAHNGGVWVPRQVAAESIWKPDRRRQSDDPLEGLSRREHQVFFLLVEGLRAKEIANRLEISAKTVDTYRASLMRKLNIHDVAGLVKFAVQRKLTS
jgi:DNA-binding NarL/FixJ family response regulator